MHWVKRLLEIEIGCKHSLSKPVGAPPVREALGYGQLLTYRAWTLTVQVSDASAVITNTKLNQLVNKPTRNTSLSSTLLDLIVTNSPALVLDHDVIAYPIADHDLLTLTVDITKPKRPPITKTFREMKNCSPELFCNVLISESNTLDNFYITDNVNTQVEIFNNVFLKSLDFCAPIVTKELKTSFAP